MLNDNVIWSLAFLLLSVEGLLKNKMSRNIGVGDGTPLDFPMMERKFSTVTWLNHYLQTDPFIPTARKKSQSSGL